VLKNKPDFLAIHTKLNSKKSANGKAIIVFRLYIKFLFLLVIRQIIIDIKKIRCIDGKWYDRQYNALTFHSITQIFSLM
jgi:hypothetical protein